MNDQRQQVHPVYITSQPVAPVQGQSQNYGQGQGQPLIMYVNPQPVMPSQGQQIAYGMPQNVVPVGYPLPTMPIQQYPQGTSVVHTQPTPVIVFANQDYRSEPSGCGKLHPNYNGRASLGIGITQILLGACCIAFNSVGIAFYSPFATISYGIWGGVFMIIAGSFGVGASCKKSTCLIVTTMVMSILAACACVCILGLAAYGLDYILGYWWCFYYNEAVCIMETMQVAFSIIDGALAITTSVLCCQALCGCCGACQGGGSHVQPQIYEGSPNVTVTQPQVIYTVPQGQIQGQIPTQGQVQGQAQVQRQAQGYDHQTHSQVHGQHDNLAYTETARDCGPAPPPYNDYDQQQKQHLE